MGLGVLVRFLTHKTTAPALKVVCIYQIAGFLMSLVWLAMLAELIIDLLELLGLLT